MSDLIYKQFSVDKKTVDAERGIFEAMITTEAVDRDGDIILADGGDLENFRKNPVVLDGHMHVTSLVVAKSLKEELIEGEGIKATFQFASRETSEHADNIRKLWEAGFLNAVSIGFILHKSEPRLDENGEELRRGRIFLEWELLEFSIVAVPANQDALRLGVKMIEDQENIDEDETLTLEELAVHFAYHFKTDTQKALNEFVELIASQIFDLEDNSREGDPTDSESNEPDDITHLDYTEIGEKLKTLKKVLKE